MPLADVNGIQLYHDSMGSGPPILWIQGLGADHTAWLAQTYSFRQSYRCLVFDNRDVGRSAKVAAPYGLADMAEDAAGLLAALGVPAAHVVGLSMGSSIAQELAIRRPEAILSLTLVSGLARPDARLVHLLKAWADIYEKAGAIEFYCQGLAWMYSYRFFERPRSIAAMLRYVAAHPQPADAFRRQAEASMRHDAATRLAEITAPTLVVAGEEDILVPRRLTRELADSIGGASMVVIEEAAHSVNVEQAAAFNRTMMEFLGKLSQRSEVGRRD